MNGNVSSLCVRKSMRVQRGGFMRLSVIISTYNVPQWLEKVIWGYAAQSHQDFELLIADDGSTEETAVCIQQLQRAVGLAIEHIWHEHNGFRKCTILNKAIVAAANEYLVFADGDCVPRWDLPGHPRRTGRAGLLAFRWRLAASHGPERAHHRARYFGSPRNGSRLAASQWPRKQQTVGVAHSWACARRRFSTL